MANNSIDFDKMRKRRQRIITLKRILALTGVMLLVAGAIVTNRFLVEEGFSTKLTDLRESLGGMGYPVDLPGGVIHHMDNIGNNLVLINDTNLYIYNSKAKMIRNIQQMTELSTSAASSSRVLAYTPGSRLFEVHSLSSELYSESAEFGIISGDMNANGDFAIVAPVKQFASKVYVYNRKFEEIYSWSSPEYVTGVAISPKGNMMALNSVVSDGGVLESLIYLFRFSEDRQQAEVAMRLPDNLCLGVAFPEDERVMVLTDKQYFCLNSTGEKKHVYDFGERQIIGIETYEKYTLLLMLELDEKNPVLVLLDQNLNEKAIKTLNAKVTDIALGRDAAYILNKNGIEVYSLDLNPKSRLEKKNISNIHLAGNRLYYLTSDEIHVLEQSEMTSVSGRKTR